MTILYLKTAKLWHRVAFRSRESSALSRSERRHWSFQAAPGTGTIRHLIYRIVCLTAVIALAEPVGAVELVRHGKPAGAIVIPSNALQVEAYAAQELQYHIEVATGAHLPIAAENTSAAGGGRIYLGRTQAAAAAKLNASELPGNGYRIKTVGDDLLVAGKDSRGDPLDTDTQEGTLFAVYDLLERELGVRWLWPGKVGEFIPRRTAVSLAPPDATVEPRLWFKHWRSGKSKGELIWLKRQRFGRSQQPQYGHSFGRYWSRFGQTHPEYFAMLPDGTRGPDPTQDPGPEYMHVCVSEPGLVRQIIADWKSRGMPRFLNICENDGWAGCACPRCLSWDEPDPDNPVAFDQRLSAAKRAFMGEDGRRDEWMLKMGSLSDRFARFWKNVADEARKSRPDVVVVSYVYDNYRRPPVKAMLDSNVLCGVVPQESIFGYSKLDSATFRHDWSGWERTGCQLFLRPNYTLQARNFPAFYARTLGEDLKFAMAHGMKGADFDSLTGRYATQGPSLYVLAQILNHPEASIDAVLDDFYAGFGPAKAAVKSCFELWESIYPNYSPADQRARIRAQRKYGCGMYGPFYLLAAGIYRPEVMHSAKALLDQARLAAAGDAAALARVEWLDKGWQNAALMLAVERSYERGVDTSDKTAFRTSYQALKDFRTANAVYDKINFAGLDGDEKVWKKAL